MNNLPKLTVEDYDTAISATGLGVVSETHMVTLRARGITVTMIIKVVATETSIAWLHPGKLKNTRIRSGTSLFPNARSEKQEKRNTDDIDSFTYISNSYRF